MHEFMFVYFESGRSLLVSFDPERVFEEASLQFRRPLLPVTYTVYLFTAMDSKMRSSSRRSTLLMTPFPACRNLTMTETETVTQWNNRKRKKRKTGLHHSHRLLSRKNINSTIAFVVRNLILLIWRVCRAILVI